MSELTAAQKTITKRAAKLANARVREELLADTGDFSLVQRLALVKGTSVVVLRTSWNPLKADMTGPSGFGYRMKVEDDRLTLEILKDTGVYERVVELGIEAMSETMVNNSQTFVSAILNNIFSPEEPVKRKHKQQSVAPVAPVEETWVKPPRPGMKRKASA